MPSAIVASVILVIIVMVPTLGWLATTNRASSLRLLDSNLVDTIIPQYWPLPNQPSTPSGFHKIKHPLPDGETKMTSFGAPFEMDFTLNDAQSSTNASLLPITMDNVFDGTFYSRSRSLRWSPEGEHI